MYIGLVQGFSTLTLLIFGADNFLLWPVHSRMFSSIYGLYLLDGSNNHTHTPTPHPTVKCKSSPYVAKYPVEEN